MRQYFKLLVLMLLQTMILSQNSDDLFRVGVDYKSKIRIDISDMEKNALQNVIESSFAKTIALMNPIIGQSIFPAAQANLKQF